MLVICVICTHKRATEIPNQQSIGWPTCCGRQMSPYTESVATFDNNSPVAVGIKKCQRG